MHMLIKNSGMGKVSCDSGKLKFRLEDSNLYLGYKVNIWKQESSLVKSIHIAEIISIDLSYTGNLHINYN